MKIPFVGVRIENKIIVSILIVLFGLLFYQQYVIMSWPAGGLDSFNHYLFAKWAPKHPEIILDQWGKTLFTLPMIPFAQFGIESIYIVNVCILLLTAVVLFKIATSLKLRYAWISVLFFLTQPVVFSNGISALTEPLNALMVSLVIFLLIEKRWIAAAILISFLPYLRTEGWVLLGSTIPFFIYYKKFRVLSLLALGSVIFGCIGLIVGKSFFWTITENPYVIENIANTDWGHGEWLTYIKQCKSIWGNVTTSFIALSGIILILFVIKQIQKKTLEDKSVVCFWLIAPLFIGYLGAHTFIWVYGMFGSNGLTRVFLVVAPASALLACYGFHKITFLEIKWLNYVLICGLSVALFIGAYLNKEKPWQVSYKTNKTPLQQSMLKCITIIKENKLDTFSFSHQLPALHVLQNTDPWDVIPKGKFIYLWSVDTLASLDVLPAKSILIWDAYHATREGKKPADVMKRMMHYKPIYTIKNEIDSLASIIIYQKK